MDWSSLLLGGQGQTPTTTYANQNFLTNGYQQGTFGAVNQQAPQLDPSQQAQFRNMQMQQAQQLQAVASGQQQGAGELAAQRQVQNAMAGQQAMTSQARGQGGGLAALNAARNSSAIGLSGAGQSQQAALQDQQNAQNALSGALSNGRGQDLSMAGQNANLQQQQYAQNNQANLGYLNGMGTMDANQLQAQTNTFDTMAGQKGIGGQLIGAGAQAIPYLMSDERLKTDITDGRDDIDRMLDGLAAKSYRYKDAKHGEGRRPGIMAQDALKSKAGAAMVIQRPEGLALDVNKALSAALASAVRLNERVRELEGRK